MVGIELRFRSKRVAFPTEVKDLKFKDLKFKDFRSHSTMQVFIKTLSPLISEKVVVKLYNSPHD
jgi:hypothetical protein